ncbi:MAG TPA: ribonuclease III [Polyangiaceae bacterium]|jgi:ribonuclease-3|nr:ribonuclease III [Polyangiaceae bacterium]
MAELCARLGLQEEPPHLREALTHPSFTNEQRRGVVVDNQRLEFLGDAVLSLCASEMLMDAFADVDEGELTVMRAALVNAEALAEGARALGIGEALQLGRGADAAGERDRSNVLADAMEAVIGAVYVDLGLDHARQVSRTLLGERIERLVDAGGMERDPKSRLQELLQARGLEAPSYQVIEIEGPPHARLFTVRVECRVDPDNAERSIFAEGQGRSKKLAEQEAARTLLEGLEAL